MTTGHSKELQAGITTVDKELQAGITTVDLAKLSVDHQLMSAAAFATIVLAIAQVFLAIGQVFIHPVSMSFPATLGAISAVVA